ncbi:hypothetical protein [Cryobacterium arcticum]|uniref:Uncharacterized protein n=1 Tax=Cryobacterium arcticum TaxID=670052 RepID=A0A318A118_9MICO|nr:hypothetical protein [Cryobacterium arcticum]PXA73247.1 hypothetical protein CTB96_00345 [Cryobacterium arcticum]
MTTEPTEPTAPTPPNDPAEPATPSAPVAPPVPAAAFAPAAATPPGPPSGPPAAGPTPPPRRGGLPGWAWALIAGAAVLLVGIVVVAVIVVNSVLGGITSPTVTEEPLAAPTATAPETADPTATAMPTEEPATGGAVPTGVTSLDDYVDVGTSFPIWRFPLEDGWEITVFDQQGVNQAQNDELGCLFTSSQNKQPPYDLDATDDRSDTEASIAALTQQMVDSVDEAAVVGALGSADIALTQAGSEDRIEFATSRVDYVNPQDGQDYTNQVGARAMPQAESFMYYVVSCPSALVEAGNSPFADLGEALAVVFE